MYQAMKVVIITERTILEAVCRIIEEMGATGYTHTTAGGKGSRGIRSQDRAAISGVMTNVKIETIVADRETAESISDAVAARFFEDYSGITYIEQVEIVRPHKFKLK